jgi:uncharacterized protein
MTIHPLTLFLLPETFAICQLAPGTPFPDWVQTNSFFSFTNTAEESSLVCLMESLPSVADADRDWRCFKLQGPIPFSLTGILNSITLPLAQANLGIFAISTYATDYVLVKQEDVPQALSTLTDAGHTIHT